MVESLRIGSFACVDDTDSPSLLHFILVFLFRLV